MPGNEQQPIEPVDVDLVADADADVVSSPEPMEAFGPYQLAGLIGRGGMAELFLALRRFGGLQQSVALKRILPSFTDSQDILKMFVQEATLTLRLEHPNIVRVLDFGHVDGQYYLAMEYLPGEDLYRVIKRCGEARVPIDIAVFVTQSIAAGLAHAHALTDAEGRPLNLIHRDVSPSNVIMTYLGVTKLVDFGIAKAEGQAVHTRTGTVKGKLAYLPPEAFTVGQTDARGDVYAVGVMLWELLAGQRLFKGPEEAAVMHRIMSGDVPRLDTLMPTVHPELAEICHKALAMKVADRYQTAAALEEALDAYLDRHHQTRPSPRRLASFLTELFGAERANAKLDLAAGTRLETSLPKVLTPLTRRPSRTSAPGLPAIGDPKGGTRTPETGTNITGPPLPPPGAQSGPGPLVFVAIAIGIFALGGAAVAALWQGGGTAGPGVSGEAVLHLLSSPEGAVVLIDGSPIGQVTPATIGNVKPGQTVNVRVELPGYRPQDSAIKMMAAEQTETLALVKATTQVTVKVPAGTTLLVDGAAVPADKPFELAPGVHSFQLERGGRVIATRRIDIQGDAAALSLP